jgi:hypothetical protein
MKHEKIFTVKNRDYKFKKNTIDELIEIENLLRQISPEGSFILSFNPEAAKKIIEAVLIPAQDTVDPVASGDFTEEQIMDVIQSFFLMRVESMKSTARKSNDLPELIKKSLEK